MKIETFENGVIYLGDCLEVLDRLGEDVAEIAVTSPPYNLTVDHNQLTRTGRGAFKQFKNWYPDRVEEPLYQKTQKEVIQHLMSACKSSIFYNHKLRYAWSGRFKHRVPSNLYHPIHWLSDFPIWAEIIWDRGRISRPQHNRFYIQDERIYQIGKPLKWTNRGLSNIWRIPPSRNDGHPCSFPVKLVENCMLSTTEEGDTILDPYLGSGTVALAAIKHNRRFVGIERDEKYFNLACRNIKRAMLEKEMWLF